MEAVLVKQWVSVGLSAVAGVVIADFLCGRWFAGPAAGPLERLWKGPKMDWNVLMPWLFRLALVFGCVLLVQYILDERKRR